jgi:hypothetical protein
MPVSPSVTTSGTPPIRLATTGVPLAIASSALRPNSSDMATDRP